jgi:integrase
MTILARTERGALCDLFDRVGPEAPTLCEGWSTRDLAAHLVIREGRPDAALGIVIPPLASRTERIQDAVARRPWGDLVDAVNLAGVRRSHPIVPVLGDDDQRLVVAACASRVVCARDAAITLLALSTGLRACDIVNLRLSDVDWRGRTISIVQRKTGNPLTVPMIELLASRRADDLLHDRPQVGDDHVFLRQVAPHVRLGDHATIHRVTTEVFRVAGVADAKVGTRVLRHNAASRMLRAATPLATISAVLGHASEESTRQYLSIDESRLLECVLAVPEGARP